MPMKSAPSTQKKPDPCSFVVFGVSGDLAHRLVIPALYNLAATELLPDRFCIVGVTRLFYLATPPDAFAPISRELGRTGLFKEENGAWRRLVIEKPFGTDLASARALNAELLKIVDEHQIYRIDHYLGKETVQNILVLRFANGMFEPIWNRNHIDHMQITVDEKIGVGHRGSFYDATGALRDMVPNHLFQLLSLAAMEPPIRFDAHSVRSEKADVLAAIQIQSEEEALR